MTTLESGNDLIRGEIFVRGVVGRARNDQRRSSFVDKDRVDLVDNRKVMVPLDERFDIELHVVAKIVETELVVGSVRDVSGVCFFPLDVIHIILDATDGKAEELMDLTHPFGVARSEIIVNGHDIDAASGKCVQV